jgi:two-component system, NarL family, invasion response regulator UvrY
MMMRTPTNISIVDDHALYRSTIARIFEINPDYHIVSQAANGEEFLQQLHSGINTDVVLLDINMPKLDGYQTLEKIREIAPKLKVIAITMSIELLSMIKMKNIGANGFISKSYEASEIVEAVSTVVQFGTYFPQLEYGNNKLVPHYIMKVISTLKKKELVFLEYACSDMSYVEIARNMHVSRFTIDDYSKSLFDKFRVHNRIALILLAIQYGLIKKR